jgi:hypothetical protein
LDSAKGKHRVDRADKNFLCIDIEFNSDFLTDCVDATAIFGVECAGFFIPFTREVNNESLRSWRGRNRWHDGGKTGAVWS